MALPGCLSFGSMERRDYGGGVCFCGWAGGSGYVERDELARGGRWWGAVQRVATTRTGWATILRVRVPKAATTSASVAMHGPIHGTWGKFE